MNGSEKKRNQANNFTMWLKQKRQAREKSEKEDVVRAHVMLFRTS